MSKPIWTGKNIDLIREACRHGESMLSAQVDIATSADQRASVLAGIYAAVATGIIGAIVTRTGLFQELPLAVGSILTAIAYLVGAALCIFATLPVSFWAPGNRPSEWYSDIEQNVPLEVAIGDQAAHFDDHIITNNKVIERNARLFFWGAVVGVTAPLLGIFFAGVTCLLMAKV